MTRALSRKQSVILGLFVVLGIGLGALALFALGQRYGLGGDGVRVIVAFADVGGVEIGTRVRIQGIDAGDVEDILPPAKPGDPVRLKLRLAGKLRHLVGTDARVEVVGDGLLAGKIVRIVPGSAGAAPVADGGELAGHNGPELTTELAQAATKLNSVLGQVNTVLDEVRQGVGPAGQITLDVAQATARLNQLLGKADHALADLQAGKGTLGKLLTNDSLYGELTGALGQINAAVRDLRDGEGTLGKLVKSTEMYSEAVRSLQDVRTMVASVKQNADAIKSMPIIRNYVVDSYKELVRPHCKADVGAYAEWTIFNPGTAVLTSEGRARLDHVAGWLNENKAAGTEIVVAAVAPQDLSSEYAQTLTQRQAEAAVEYLKSNHKVHKRAWWWWSTRPVRALGWGNAPYPHQRPADYPQARLEVFLFTPQN